MIKNVPAPLSKRECTTSENEGAFIFYSSKRHKKTLPQET